MFIFFKYLIDNKSINVSNIYKTFIRIVIDSLPFIIKEYLTILTIINRGPALLLLFKGIC